MELKTERLYIRPVHIDDKEAMFIYRSDPETNQHLSFVPKSIKDIAEFIGKNPNKVNIPGTWFQLVLIEKHSNLLIGDIGIHFLDNGTENKQVEIGYTLNKKHRGNGYATEALTKIIDFLISSLNKHRITASIDPSNIDSIKLIERLGFRKEGHFVESVFFHGKWADDLIYALLAKDIKQNLGRA